jgi:Rha family phage regulatory protein
MTDIKIVQKDNSQITNSKNVADVFGKSHRNVTADIKKLDCSDEFRALNFQHSSYLSKQNKRLSCIEMTKDGFAFLCMGYTGKKAAKYKEEYISEFNRMAETLNSISSRINKLEIEGREIKKLGREWSELGREINKSKKDHVEATNKLMDEVQLKLEI